MSLHGRGAVAIWNDVTAEGRDAVYDWHGNEHVAERVGIPGFLRGRRYVAIHGSPEYFTLYEAESPAVLAGPAYAARLNNPTPWTSEAIRYFRNVGRSLCEIAASFGATDGGLIATWRYDVPDAEAARHRREMTQRILPDLAKAPGVAGAHLLVADIAASSVETVEKRARGGGNQIPRWILMVEGWGDVEPFDALCRKALGDAVLRAAGASGAADFGLYRLQLERTKLAR